MKDLKPHQLEYRSVKKETLGDEIHWSDRMLASMGRIFCSFIFAVGMGVLAYGVGLTIRRSEDGNFAMGLGAFVAALAWMWRWKD